MPYPDIPPVSAITDKGEDILKLINYEDGVSYSSISPGYIDLIYKVDNKISNIQSLGEGDGGGVVIGDPPKGGTWKVVVDENSPSTTNIFIISAKNIAGIYEEVEKIYPRKQKLKRLIDLSNYISSDTLQIRLEWMKGIEIDQLLYNNFERLEPDVKNLSLISAIHSKEGLVTNTLDRESTESISLEPGQDIELTYKAEPLPKDMMRILAFISNGKYSSIFDLSKYAEESTPDDFSFEQNYPNPFNPVTTFRFSLPYSSDVKLDIYNVLGQKVATIIDMSLPAGIHNCEWDSHDNSGNLVASGIYFAKLKAGNYTSTKKMVVIK